MNRPNAKIMIIPTDTLYGLVGSAFSPRVVEQIYQLRQRPPYKPTIILISKFKDLELFGVKPDLATRKILRRYWPGRVSIILPLPPDKKILHKFKYLHRGTGTLSFRLPAKDSLMRLLRKTGPLIAPSANPSGQPPATTVAEARGYFGDQVNTYHGRQRLTGPASRLIRIVDGKVEIIRH